MGDKANILVKDNGNDNGVYLYTHWNGSELLITLQKALAKDWRWNDGPYLTRIIFDAMTEGQHDEETGFGIATYAPDGESRVLEVNCTTQSVSKSGVSFSFKEYIALSEDELYSKLKW